MALVTAEETPPLVTDRHGVVRVGSTRVTLETVVGAFQDGATAEEIALRYPALALVDVYATIAFYLRHRDEVDRYLVEQSEKAAALQREAETFFDTRELRRRLLARRRGA